MLLQHVAALACRALKHQADWGLCQALEVVVAAQEAASLLVPQGDYTGALDVLAELQVSSFSHLDSALNCVPCTPGQAGLPLVRSGKQVLQLQLPNYVSGRDNPVLSTSFTASL